MVPPYMIPAPASRVGVASIYAGKYTIKFDENGGGSRKGPYLLMSLMDGPEGRREVQCALVHANSRDSATGPTNLNLNGFVGARAEQSSTFLAASPPPSPLSLPPSLAKQVQFRFSSNGKIAVGGVGVQLDSHFILRQGASNC